jgi:hypothetical protein
MSERAELPLAADHALLALHQEECGARGVDERV